MSVHVEGDNSLYKPLETLALCQGFTTVQSYLAQAVIDRILWDSKKYLNHEEIEEVYKWFQSIYPKGKDKEKKDVT